MSCDEVALERDTIYSHSLRKKLLETLKQACILCSQTLGVYALHVVVIPKQQRMPVRSLGRVKCKGEIIVAERVVEEVVLHATIPAVTQCLIH